MTTAPNAKIEVELRIGGDHELECMDCLNQVMDHMIKDLDQDTVNRIAEWFKNRHHQVMF